MNPGDYEEGSVTAEEGGSDRRKQMMHNGRMSRISAIMVGDKQEEKNECR